MLRTALVGAALLVALPSWADEQWFGFEVGLGGATITAPNDEIGDPSLLHGSAFTGPLMRIGVTYERALHPLVRGGVELGLGSYAMKGFAERDTQRRELNLGMSAADVMLRARVEAPRGWAHPCVGVAAGGRWGLRARISEQSRGPVDDESLPPISTGNGVLVALDLGVILDRDRLRIPLMLRAARNLTYGSSTRSRFRDYQDTANPGELIIEANWSYAVSAGVTLPF